MSKLDEMWAALEAHKPKRGYAEAWQTMCRERTYEAVEAAYRAAPALSLAEAAARAAAWATGEACAAAADRHAQEAINAIKREVKP
jgi:hypothetical protein